MPCGLGNAAQTSQRFIRNICRGLPFVSVYVDDILAASTPSLHNFKLIEFDITDHQCRQKCPRGFLLWNSLVTPSLLKAAVLCSLRSRQSLTSPSRPFYRKCATSLNCSRPHTLKCARSSLAALSWTTATEQSLNNAKHAFADEVLSKHLLHDAPRLVMVDSSDIVVGAVLQQFIRKG